MALVIDGVMEKEVPDRIKCIRCYSRGVDSMSCLPMNDYCTLLYQRFVGIMRRHRYCVSSIIRIGGENSGYSYRVNAYGEYSSCLSTL